MQKLQIGAGVLVAALLAAVGCGSESESAGAAPAAGSTPESTQAPAPATSEPTAQTVAFNENCPTSGRAVNASIGTIEHNGKQVGFCCAGCKAGWANVPVEQKDAFVAGEG
jgi:FtsP/CotA-like multicopper oxidase with cupredoxin domain